MSEHWFWWLVVAACMAWYSTVTVYVAIKGFVGIRRMLARLESKTAANDRVDEH